MSYPYISFEQPAGTFYMSAMPIGEIIRIAQPKPRIFDPKTLTSSGGIQRELSVRRIRDIADYAETTDAAFPTPILLAVSSNDCVIENGTIYIPADNSAEIIDGQHRVYGLREAKNKDNFVVPVVIIVDPTEEEKALLFATINSTQTKVPASLIYELFAVSESRSPQKTCHEIARSLNSLPESPWFRRLKMLGRKSEMGSNESLSQGTFIKFLLPLVSNDPGGDMETIKQGSQPVRRPNCVFNDFFRDGKDATILKILLNAFCAARDVWPKEWADPKKFVLTKTLGFSGIMRAMNDMVNCGLAKNDLSLDFFSKVFKEVSSKMTERQMSLTSEFFSASALGEAEFARLIKEEIPKLTWKESVAAAIKRLIADSPQSVFTRQQLIQKELKRIVSEVGAESENPEQTLSRTLQELRDDGLVSFESTGEYRIIK